MFKTPLAALCSAALICAGTASTGFAQTAPSGGSTVRGSSTTTQTQQDRESSRSNRDAAENQGRSRSPRRQRQAAP